MTDGQAPRPFVAGELQQSDPDTFALLRDIWGPLPEREDRPPSAGP